MAITFNSSDPDPSIPVTAQTGRVFIKDMDFTGRDGNRVKMSRRAVSGVFQDCTGNPVMAQFLPVANWDIDIKALSSTNVLFAVSSFDLDKNGVCLCRFNGFEVLGSELKRKS